MNYELISFIQNDLVNTIIRLFSLVFLVIFILYSLLTVRQVSIMNHSLVTQLAIEITLLAWFQFALGVVALITVLFFG